MHPCSLAFFFFPNSAWLKYCLVRQSFAISCQTSLTTLMLYFPEYRVLMIASLIDVSSWPVHAFAPANFLLSLNGLHLNFKLKYQQPFLVLFLVKFVHPIPKVFHSLVKLNSFFLHHFLNYLMKCTLLPEPVLGTRIVSKM